MGNLFPHGASRALRSDRGVVHVLGKRVFLHKLLRRRPAATGPLPGTGPRCQGHLPQRQPAAAGGVRRSHLFDRLEAARQARQTTTGRLWSAQESIAPVTCEPSFGHARTGTHGTIRSAAWDAHEEQPIWEMSGNPRSPTGVCVRGCSARD